MNLPDHDIVFSPDPELKEHWLDGWDRTSTSGRVARGFIVAGVACALVFVAFARGPLRAVGVAGGLLVSLAFFLAIWRGKSAAARGISDERLLIDREGYLIYVRRDERELVDTGDDRYFWGRTRQPRHVLLSVAYLPECEFYLLDEFRELVVMPSRSGAVRERRFADERELEASGALRSRLNVGHSTPEDLAADAFQDRELGIELFPYFSPDLAITLRELGVPEARRRA